MKREILTYQIGKQGLTEEFIQHLASAFTTHKDIRVQVLPSADEVRKRIREIPKEITAKLTGFYETRVVGFTIFIRKKRNK
jgi:RNA-binding protein YhbY